MSGASRESDHGTELMRNEPFLGRVVRHMMVHRIPEPVRYGAAVLLVGACLLIRICLPTRGLPFLAFIPGLIAASLFFGRGPGLLAVVLSTATALILLIDPIGSFVVAGDQVWGVALFVLIGIGIAILCHTLRTSLVQLIRAEREKSLLLDELNHRTKNNLQMVSSLLILQSRAVSEPEAAQALKDAAARVHVLAKLHDRLQPDGREGLVNMRDYLDELCNDLSATLRAIRPVAITVGAEPIVVSRDVAAPIGLIVNELVTNCLKYAFPNDAAGRVSVAFETAGNNYALTVRDNGIGAAPHAKDGLGSRLTGMLVQQLDGRMTRGDAMPGTLTIITIPRRNPTLAA